MEAMLYEKLPERVVKCKVCPHYCVIKDKERGKCGVRENKDGKLYALNYSRSIASSIDPIEKKPLYHYMQNTSTYSFASVGCNLECPWCQNFSISQSPKTTDRIEGIDIKPAEHVKRALDYRCPSVSYTYSEPTIFLEYALDTMKLAKKEGLKNIWVTNGFMSEDALNLILPYLDAANIDYKGKNEVYKKYCKGNSKTVLNNMKRIKDEGVHLEITTLLIPGINDSKKHIKSIIEDIKSHVGLDTPWHISRFFPNYLMKDKSVTPIKTIKLAEELGLKAGLKNIHLGNI